MAKIEIGENRPPVFRQEWPGQYDIFSHYEFACGVPSVVSLITTLKDNGTPNACLHAWSTFSGDSGGFFAILSGLMKSTHTYQNIMRDKEFCVNFLDIGYFDNCWATIEKNDRDVDELSVAGLSAEPSKVIRPPRVKEAFLTYECTLESEMDLSGKGMNALVIGRVKNACVDEEHHNFERICEQGFLFNIHSPKDARTGEGTVSAIAKLQVLRKLG